MKKYFNTSMLAVILGFFIMPLFSFDTNKTPTPSPLRWEKLGERKVNFRVDRDEIMVGVFEGFFDALKIKVKKGPINMHRMVVHFRSGQTTEIELRNNYTAGSESRVIDLPGNNRMISKVVFWYDTKNFTKSRAVLELWGRH